MTNIVVITSPPFLDQVPFQGRAFSPPHESGLPKASTGYGHTQGQLGAMKEGKMTLIESTVTANIPTEDWYGCYDDGWKGLITDDSFGHPAKMAKGLVYRIVREMLQRGWLTPGSTVIDPFGGIGSTGIACSAHGLRSISIELEQRFIEMAKANFELHRQAWAAMNLPQPVILQGDSRDLLRVLGQPSDELEWCDCEET